MIDTNDGKYKYFVCAETNTFSYNTFSYKFYEIKYSKEYKKEYMYTILYDI